MDVESDTSYHLLASFGVEGSNFTVVYGNDWIPIHVRRGLDGEKLVYLSVIVVSWAVLMGQYHCFGAVIEVFNMVEMGVQKY